MDNIKIHNYITKKYINDDDIIFTYIVLIDINIDINCYIGKRLFTDSDCNYWGIKILGTDETFLFNIKRNKTFSESFKNIIIINPNIFNDNDHILISCEKTILNIIDDIKDINPSIKINHLYKKINVQ